MGRSPVRVAVVGVELRPVDVRDAGEIERALAAFARPKNGGPIATGSAATIVHRDHLLGR
jgi:putative tryptophan/tyrosine transport system substrate-binding protein